MTKEEEIEFLAGLQFSREEIELMTGDEADPFEIGKLKMEVEVRKSIFDHAKAGSSPAHAQALKLIERRRLEDEHG